MTMMQVVWWALAAAAVLGACVYGYIEYHAYMLRTKITTVDGGLEFFSQVMTVQSRHAAREVVVHTRRGNYTHQKAAADMADSKAGALTATFSAIGLHISNARIVIKPEGGGAPLETGFSTIEFQGSDDLISRSQGRTPSERSSLVIDHVPNPIADDFQHFANRLNLWIGKIEHGIKVDIERRRKEEEERARAEALAAAKAKKAAPVILTDAEREAKAGAQVEVWREAAGFKGSSSEISIDASGEVVWFIDLHPTGRIILHSGKRTFYGSLQGAKVMPLAGELEIGVRDAYWSPEEPQLTPFKVLAGTTPENRVAWKERLDILIRGLG